MMNNVLCCTIIASSPMLHLIHCHCLVFAHIDATFNSLSLFNVYPLVSNKPTREWISLHYCATI